MGHRHMNLKEIPLSMKACGFSRENSFFNFLLCCVEWVPVLPGHLDSLTPPNNHAETVLI